MATQEKHANAQLRRIPLAQGGGMGSYATEDIWHGQEMLVHTTLALSPFFGTFS